MKKTLIIVAHPRLTESVVNQHWVNELKKYPDKFTIHEIYKEYPDSKINYLKEQLLISKHENLILQFPIYWFNCPPLLKQWLDEVFTYGWAFGGTGNSLKNKKIMLAVSTGSKLNDYSNDGKYKSSLSQILYPFELLVSYVQANYQPIHAFYGTENTPSLEDLNKNAIEYSKKILDII